MESVEIVIVGGDRDGGLDRDAGYFRSSQKNN